MEILPLYVPYTGAKASSPLSCLLCHFGMHFLECSAERALNLGITGAFWDRFGSLQSSASCKSGFHLIACKCSRSP